MSELGSLSKIVTESSLVQRGQGKVRGLIVSSHTSGTMVLKDGLSNAGSAKANATLTVSGGGLVPAKYARNTLTIGATDYSDNDTVTIGSTVYRLKSTLALAYDVKIGASVTATMLSLLRAINASGTAGTDYFAGTLVHPDVIAVSSNATTVVVSARVIGSVPNAIVTTENSAQSAWAETTLGGASATTIGVATAGATFTINGRAYYFTTILAETLTLTAIVDQILWVTNDEAALANMKKALNGSGTEGTDFSTGTDSNALVVATTIAATTIVVNAIVNETAGNSITVTEGMANATWGSGVTTLTGGTDESIPMTGTYTYAAGSQVIRFPDAINFSTGLYAFTNGTAQSTTVVYS